MPRLTPKGGPWQEVQRLAVTGNIRPCAHCGNTLVSGARALVLVQGEATQRRTTRAGYWVACQRCGATGPLASTQEGALQAWERREKV